MKIANYNIGLNSKSARKFEESFEYNKKQELIDLSDKSKLELESVGEKYSYSKDETKFEKKVLVKVLEKLYSFKDETKTTSEKIKSEEYYDKTTLKWDRGALFDNGGGIRKNTLQQSYKSAEKQKLNFEAKGSILTEDGKEINFDLKLNLSHEFIGRNFKKVEFIDPLVINFDSPSIELSSKKFEFDIDNDGFSEQISYLNSGSGFLALDKNGDGIINNGNELFGTNGMGGFSELSLYDDDKNGFIDENDEIFNKLRIWRKSESESKLVALGEVGIGTIYLGSATSEYALKDENNNTLGKIEESGIAIKENGDIVTTQSVNFTKISVNFKDIKGETKLDDIFNFDENFINGVGGILGDREVDITDRIIQNNQNDGIKEQFNFLINNQRKRFSDFNNNFNNKTTEESKSQFNVDNSVMDKTKEMALKNAPRVSELKAKISTLEKELSSFKFQLKSESSSNIKIGLEQNIAKLNSKINYNNLTIQALKAEEFLSSIKN